MDYTQIGGIIAGIIFIFVWLPALWAGIKAIGWYIDDRDFKKFDSKYWTLFGRDGGWMTKKEDGIPIPFLLSIACFCIIFLWPAIILFLGFYFSMRTARFLRRGQKAVMELGGAAHVHKNGEIEKVAIDNPEF